MIDMVPNKWEQGARRASGGHAGLRVYPGAPTRGRRVMWWGFHHLGVKRTKWEQLYRNTRHVQKGTAQHARTCYIWPQCVRHAIVHWYFIRRTRYIFIFHFMLNSLPSSPVAWLVILVCTEINFFANMYDVSANIFVSFYATVLINSLPTSPVD